MKFIRYGLIALAGMAALAGTAKANVLISGHVTQNMQCNGGVCIPTAARAWLNVSDLTGMLANEYVTVETSAAAPNISVNTAFSWSSSNGLSLQAQGNLTINRVIRDEGFGPVNLSYNASGAGSMLSFGKTGRLTFSNTSTSLSINGQAFVLVANIATLARLIQDNPSGDFALAANYNAKRDGTYPQSPVLTPFAGILEGLGNTISNLVVEDQNQNSQGDGFLYQTHNTAVLANLVLKAEITGVGLVGGLVADNQGTVSANTFAGNIVVTPNNGSCVAGGIAGANDGTISLTNASGSVTDRSDCVASYLGGSVGINGYTTYAAQFGISVASGSVTSVSPESAIVGGSVGANYGLIANASASGPATAPETSSGCCFQYIGGLVGYNQNSISDTSATGAATGGDYAIVGGLVGNNESGVDTCTSKYGAVSGGNGSVVGGAFGYDGGSVSNCVSYGAVSGGSGAYVGGFVGAAGGSYSNDQWDITTSGNACAAGNACTVSGITGFY